MSDYENLASFAREALEIAEDFYMGDGTGFVGYAAMAQKLAYLAPRLARAVLDQQAEIERLQSELRIEKASQATRGNE